MYSTMKENFTISMISLNSESSSLSKHSFRLNGSTAPIILFTDALYTSMHFFFFSMLAHKHHAKEIVKYSFCKQDALTIVCFFETLLLYEFNY